MGNAVLRCMTPCRYVPKFQRFYFHHHGIKIKSVLQFAAYGNCLYDNYRLLPLSKMASLVRNPPEAWVHIYQMSRNRVQKPENCYALELKDLYTVLQREREREINNMS